MLERRGTDDQHALDPDVAGHDLDGGDRLDGLPQPHVVADDASARPAGEERRFLLVVVQPDAEQVLEARAADVARERLDERPLPALGVTHLGDEAERVLVAPEVGSEASRRREEHLEVREGVGAQRPIGAEVPRGQARQLGGCVGARPEPHLTPGAVVEIDLAERRLDAARQRLAHARLSFQPRQGELDVLARPQRVRREVGARAEVVPRLAAPDHHPVAVPRERIGDLELRGDRMAARALLEEELLLAAELLAQRSLPRLERHLLRPVEPRELPRDAAPARSTRGAALFSSG